MQSVLRGLENHCLPYIDDVILVSTTFEDHLCHITSVLSRLSNAGLTVKQSKCSWCFKFFDFLGFHVRNGLLSIPEARVALITNYIIPSTNPSLSHHTSVLNYHTRRAGPEQLQHDDDFITAFQFIISSISHHASLTIPDCHDAWCVFTDASYQGIGGSLCVYRNNTWTPCSFYSRQLLPREKNYAIIDLEALALLATATHFHFYLSGRFFKAFTDHSPLVNIINGQPPSARLCRWKHVLSDYHFELIYIKGEVNSEADALSRQSWQQTTTSTTPTTATSTPSLQVTLRVPPDTLVSERGGDVVKPPT